MIMVTSALAGTGIKASFGKPASRLGVPVSLISGASWVLGIYFPVKLEPAYFPSVEKKI
jgi:hypothetical protein